MNKSEQVLKMLVKIPRGKITTYKELAHATNSSPRAVGQIMRRNTHPGLYPCYKVIKSSGDIGGYDGCTKGSKVNKKIMLLRKDGIIIEKGKVNIEKYLYRF